MNFQSAERDEISVEDVSSTKVKSVSHQQTTQITFLNTDRSRDKCVLTSPSCSSVKNNSKVKSVSHQQTTQITFLNTDRSRDKCVLTSPSCSSVKNNSKVKSVSHQQTTQITFLNTDRSGDKCVFSSPSCSSVKNNSKQGKVCIKECCTNPKVRGQPLRLSTECHPFDIGVNLHKISSFSNEEKVNFLSKVWIPPVDYDFPKYFANNKHWSFNRKFIAKDRKEYHHWLVYSAYYDGVFCLPCVLFGNNIARNSTLLT